MNKQQGSTVVAISIIAAALIIAGAIFYTQGDKTTQLGDGSEADVKTKVTLNETGNIVGNEDAKVTIVEFSDFQCPYCKSFHPTTEQILADYPDQVKLIYKHFPLDQIHQNARPAAEASECAAEQGMFWEFAGGLFENQESLGNDFYTQLASNLMLDTTKFEACVFSRQYKDKVEADYQEGIKAGVRGTPANFINGKSLPGGAVPYTTLKAAVDQALSELK